MLYPLALLAGCASAPRIFTRTDVSTDIQQRTSWYLGPRVQPSETIYPNGSSLADGLTEEEAILLALWNNALFQELLTDLEIAQGDLIQAGLLPNPEVVYFFPVTGKPFKYALDFPIESLWLRPIRVAAAQRESARVSQLLSQRGLDLIRNVRQAYADVLLAQGNLRVTQQALDTWRQIVRLTEARQDAGDISIQEVQTARIDYLRSEQDAVRVGFDVTLAEARLRNLMGVGVHPEPIQLIDPAPTPRPDLDVPALTEMAMANRPDALSATQAVAAAAERARLARSVWFRLLGIADATSGSITGHEFGPAFRVTLPLFNWNQGNVARADAEWQKASRQRETLRQQIALDVQLAHAQYGQALAELQVVEKETRPQADEAIRRTELAYREGETPYVVVLQTTRQYLDTHFRQEQLRANLRKAWAELERSAGRRLDVASAEPVPPPVPQPPAAELPAPRAAS